ncbi:MAG TPA: zinc ribbon domain-containing protein [Bryobacteraceae bacterium]|jgi:putative FmdB family regulatory protein|nr:zinc ribbon domain-containing protein [Bryobacteraceae bacterium]
MPLYEYRCAKCGKVFEVIQKFSDVPLAMHENCGGAVERLISPPAFQFKGSGWYITDYAKGNSSQPDSKPAETQGDAKPAESKSGESKPAESKSESKPASTDKTS